MIIDNLFSFHPYCLIAMNTIWLDESKLNAYRKFRTLPVHTARTHEDASSTLPICSFPPRSDITAQGDQTAEPRLGLEPKAPQLSSHPLRSAQASTCTHSRWRHKLATGFCVTLRRRSPWEECCFLNTAEVTRSGFLLWHQRYLTPVVQPGGHIADWTQVTLLTWMNRDGFPKAVLLNRWSLRNPQLFHGAQIYPTEMKTPAQPSVYLV